jgi:hypothetical protein
MSPYDEAVSDYQDELQNFTESSRNIQLTVGVPIVAENEFLTAKERTKIFVLLGYYAA